MTSKNFFYFSEFFLLHPLPSQNLYFFHLSVFHGYFLYQLYLIREVLLYRCLPRPLYHLALKNFFPSLDLTLFPDLFFLNYRFRFLYFFCLYRFLVFRHFQTFSKPLLYSTSNSHYHNRFLPK